MKIAPSSAQDAEQARRLHDLTNALRVLRFAYEAIENGYTFQDEGRDAKLKSMERALEVIERESQIILENLQ